MSRVLSYAVLALLAAAAVVYFTYGPNVFLGGPSKSDIVEIARQDMIASSATDELKQVAQNAAITPAGICNSMPNGTYACGVEVAVSGQPAITMVAILKKGPNGEWVSGN